MTDRALVSVSLLASITGCVADAPPMPEDSDDVHVESGLPEDTDVDESPDSAVDTDTELPTWTAVTLSPPDLRVGVGATVAYRLRGTSPAGVRGTPTDVEWETSDAGVAIVEAGVVTAVGPGTATITAVFDAQQQVATLKVDGDGAIAVTVVDSATGEGMLQAGVQVGELELARTDVDGRTEADGIPGTPISVCAWADDYYAACALGVIGRDVVLPLRAHADAAEPATLSGAADLSSFETDAGHIAVGLIAPGIAGSPWWMTLDDVIGPPRSASLYGIQTTLPSNLVVKGEEESWYVDAVPGERSVWTLGALVPLADALAVAAGEGNALGFVSDNLDQALWDTEGTWSLIGADEQEVGTCSFEATLEQMVHVSTAALPSGTAGDELAVLLPMIGSDGGYLATSLATGLGDVDVPSADEPDLVVGIVQTGDLGAGGGFAVAVTEPEGLAARLPPWLAIPTLPVVFPDEDRLVLNVDPSAQLLVIEVLDPQFRERDLYVAPGLDEVSFPDIPPPLDLGNATWDLRVVGTDATSFEEILASGPIDIEALTPEVTGVSRVKGLVHASQ